MCLLFLPDDYYAVQLAVITRLISYAFSVVAAVVAARPDFFIFFLYLARRDVMTLAHLENGRWRETRELCFVVLSSAATASLKREEK